MPYHDPMAKKKRAKIAQSFASANPITPQAPLQAPSIQTQESPLMGVGKKLLGGFLGGLFNKGGSVVDDKDKLKKIREQQKARMAAQQAQQAAQANSGTKRIAPQRRVLFDEGMNKIGNIQGGVIDGYADRPTQDQAVGKAQLVDPFEGIAAKIQAAKAAGKPVDYNALAALQHARSTQNEAERMKKLRQFMERYPGFALPGGSQGVVLRKKNIGGPISLNYGLNMGGMAKRYGYNVGGMVPNPMMMGPLNPNGYNEGGPVPSTPIKKVMDEDKIEIQRETFERAEARKDAKFKMDEKRAAEKHAMDMKLKKQAAVTKKAPLAK